MAVSIVQAAPDLGRASCVSCMGSHLGKCKTTGTSFLPTATAWDFSPPPLPPVLLGIALHPRAVPTVVRRKRRANLHVDSCHPTASSSPIPPPHLESLTCPGPGVVILPTHPLSLSFPIPKGPVTKSLGMSQAQFCVYMWAHLIPRAGCTSESWGIC